MYCYCYWLSSVAAVTALLLLPKSSSAIDDASARSVTRTRTRNDSKRFDLNEYINFLQDGRDADADGIGISIEDDELPIIDFEVSYWQQDDELPNTLLFDEPLRRTLSAQGLSSEDHSSSSSYLPSWSNDTDTTTSAADKTNNTNLRPKQQKQSRRRLQANCVLGSNPGPACTVNALRNCVNNANQNERIEICNNGITFGPGDASILVQTAVTFTCMGCTDDQIDPVLTLRRTTSANGPDNGRFFNVGNLAINSSLKFIGIRFQRGVYGSASNLQNQSGGAVRITDNNVQNILFRACTFSRNQSAAYGGGVFIQAQNANVSFERCVFDQNLSLNDYGGALAMQSVRSVKLEDCNFFQNQSQGRGGGAFYAQQVRQSVGDGNSVIINRCQFGTAANDNYGNKSNLSGGAIIVAQVEGGVLLTDTVFANNESELKHQGAVRIQTANSVIVRNNYFLENKAPNGFCGALSIKDVRGSGNTLIVENNAFERNEAKANRGWGGGIDIRGASSGAAVKLVNNCFLDNELNSGNSFGAAVYVEQISSGSSLTISNMKGSGNSAKTCDGIYNGDSNVCTALTGASTCPSPVAPSSFLRRSQTAGRTRTNNQRGAN